MEVVMVAIGIVVIGISFIMEKRMTILKNKCENEELLKLREEIEKLKENTENMYYDTEEKLSKLSCKKMSELTEFSEQIIEKIALNHKEVIFLYDMLNEKDKEVKIALGKLEDAKFEINKMLVDINEAKLKNVLVDNPLTGDAFGTDLEEKTKTTKRTSTTKSTKKTAAKSSDKADNTIGTMQSEMDLLNIIAQDPDGEIEPVKKTTRKRTTKAKTQAEALSSEEVTEKKTKTTRKRTTKKAVTESVNEAIAEVVSDKISHDLQEKTSAPTLKQYKVENDQVLKLYKEGLSYVDISKKLNIGMGEVMLVVNLYKDM